MPIFFQVKSWEALLCGKLGTEPLISPRSELHASFYLSR